MKDDLGKRMKENYEHRTRYLLPRRTYTIIRLDGKAFHSYTKNCKCLKPFDPELMKAMDISAKQVCNEIQQGVVCAYVQSDEVSVLLTDFSNPKTDAWFSGNIQKMASVSASLMTGFFGAQRVGFPLAFFDARVFTIPDSVEVENYLVWRQKDATRNSIQMAAQALFSHKELQGKNCDALQELMWQKGTNWNDYSAREKRGRMILKNQTDLKSSWFLDDPPVFTQEREYLTALIPKRSF